MEIVDELQIDQANNANIVPVVPPSPIYLVVEEVPMDQLVGSDDEEPPVHDENPPEQAAEENQDGIQIEQLQEPLEENQAFPEEAEFFEALIAENNQQLQIQNNNSNNMQIGRVLIQAEKRDPAWTQYMRAESARLWARFFSTEAGENGLRVPTLDRVAHLLAKESQAKEQQP